MLKWIIGIYLVGVVLMTIVWMTADEEHGYPVWYEAAMVLLWPLWLLVVCGIYLFKWVMGYK